MLRRRDVLALGC